MNKVLHSKVAKHALGIENGIVILFGFTFPCDQEQYGLNIIDWLSKVDVHTRDLMTLPATWSSTWQNGFCTITYSQLP